MKRRTIIFCVVAALLVVAPLSSSADYLGVPDLDIEVRDALDAAVGSDMTDALGNFSVGGLQQGDYTLVVSDPLSNLGAVLDLTVLPEDEPAVVWGRVSASDGHDASVKVAANLYAEGVAGEFSVRLQRKWNRNAPRSRGWLQVKITGDGVETITAVSLASSEGALDAASVRIDPEGQMAKAFFKKADAYLALVPVDAGRGDTVEITVTVDTPAGPQIFTRTVEIKGKKK